MQFVADDEQQAGISQITEIYINQIQNILRLRCVIKRAITMEFRLDVSRRASLASILLGTIPRLSSVLLTLVTIQPYFILLIFFGLKRPFYTTISMLLNIYMRDNNVLLICANSSSFVDWPKFDRPVTEGGMEWGGMGLRD